MDQGCYGIVEKHLNRTLSKNIATSLVHNNSKVNFLLLFFLMNASVVDTFHENPTPVQYVIKFTTPAPLPQAWGNMLTS